MERAQKEHLLRLKARGEIKEVGSEAEVEEKHAAKQAAIRKQQGIMTLKARTEQLKDELKVLRQNADVKQASIRYSMVTDKAQAERDGLEAIAAYKRSLDKKAHGTVKQAVHTALEQLEDAIDSSAPPSSLKKTLKALQKESKKGSTASSTDAEAVAEAPPE